MAKTKLKTNSALCSMTGFGSAAYSSEAFSVDVEIKSLNSRFLDVNIKTAKLYSSIESDIKSIIDAHLSRGRIDVQVFRKSSNSTTEAVSLNEGLLQNYLAMYQQGCKLAGADLPSDSSAVLDILARKDVFEVSEDALTEAETEAVLDTVKDAVLKLVQSREKEGGKLCKDLDLRIKNLSSIAVEIKALSAENTQLQKNKLSERIAKLAELADLDAGRLEVETAILADKLDISEELVRLEAHLGLFCEILAAPPHGKKLDFVLQEIGRELNTIASKAQNSDIQTLIVNAKGESERIKEQVQNLE